MLMRVRQGFWGQCQESHTNYVYDVLSICLKQNMHDSNKKIQCEFRLNGVAICCKAWYEMHGVPKTSFYCYKEKFESGVRQYVQGNTWALRRALVHTYLARALLNEFVDNYSE